MGLGQMVPVHASRLREQGRIRNLTMGELAEELRSTQQQEVSA